MKTDSAVSQRATKPRCNIDWAFFRAIPIESAAEFLGIEVDKNGRFLCPSHNDTNPSAQINKKNGSWCCWSCHAGGSAIDLVMASTGRSTVEAVKLLDTAFPGGIEYIGEDEPGLSIPYVPSEVLKDIGLQGSPFATYHAKIPKRYNAKGYPSSQELVSFKLEYEEAAGLVINKAVERQNSLMAEAEDILRRFPEIDEQSRAHIMEVTKRRQEKLGELISTFQVFLCEVISLEEEDKAPWDEELESSGIEEDAEEKEMEAR